jgi:hypothetical protein
LDPRIAEVAEVVGSLIKMLPTRGKVDDATAILLRMIVDRLMNPSELIKKGFPKLLIDDDSTPVVAKSVAKPLATKTAPTVKDDPFDSAAWGDDDDDDATSVASIVGNHGVPFDSDPVAW